MTIGPGIGIGQGKREQRKKIFCEELSDLLNSNPPLTQHNFPLKVDNVESLLNFLSIYQKPEDQKIKGERPPTPKQSISESVSHFRQNTVEYIEINTGYRFLVDPSLPTKHYNSIMDYLGI
jgi:hypothetical protein